MFSVITLGVFACDPMIGEKRRVYHILELRIFLSRDERVFKILLWLYVPSSSVYVKRVLIFNHSLDAAADFCFVEKIRRMKVRAL